MSINHHCLSSQEPLQMNTQIARILDSDHSLIQNAIQNKIQSIDQCLTSRSNFLSMFQQMLKKQMRLSQDNLEQQQSAYKPQQKCEESQKSWQFSTKQQFCQKNQSLSHLNTSLSHFNKISYKQHQQIKFTQSQLQLQTARQIQVQGQFYNTKKQITQSSFGFTSRESTASNQDHYQVKQKSRDKMISCALMPSVLKFIYQKTVQVAYQCRQLRDICLSELSTTKKQMKQIISNSLCGVVQIINFMYQKKIQQLIQQSEKFKNQTKKLKQEISFRNLASSSFFNQNQTQTQSQRQSQTQSLSLSQKLNQSRISSQKLNESQKPQYFQNTFARIPLPQIKTNNFYQYQSSLYNNLKPKEDSLYTMQKQDKYTEINSWSNNYFMEKSKMGSNLSFNSFSSDCQNSKSQWKQIKFSLKKQNKQNQFSKNKISFNCEQSHCSYKKLYNNFYDFQPIQKVQIKYPPVLDGYATISQQSLSYQGTWKNGLIHGKGKLATTSFTYEGQFWYGCFQGKGFYKTGKLQYSGHFRNHMADGVGTLLLKKQKIHGEWKQNKFIRRN